MMNTKAIVVLGQDDWEISFPIGVFNNRDTGKSALDDLKVIFSTATPSPSETIYGILVKFHDYTKFLTDGDVEIKEMSSEAKARIGDPIDVSTDEGKEKAIQSLFAMDPRYVLGEDDFVKSEKTLKDFVENYGVGYKPDAIGEQLIDL